MLKINPHQVRRKLLSNKIWRLFTFEKQLDTWFNFDVPLSKFSVALDKVDAAPAGLNILPMLA
jgi:hypothetical protein